MRIIGLDYGSKTVGVAVSDELGYTAQALETIPRKKENQLRKTLARIEELIKEYDAEGIVVGYPRHMNGDAGLRCEQTEAFGAMLARRTELPVYFQDERLSTVSAEKLLMDGGVRRENRKDYVDKIAAAIILQTYLEKQSRKDEE